MQAEINRYCLAPRGHPDHTYEFFLEALERHVQLFRQEKNRPNREEFLRGLQSTAGGQQKALLAMEHDGLAVQTSRRRRCVGSSNVGTALGLTARSCVRSVVIRTRAKQNNMRSVYGDKCRYRHAARDGLVASDVASDTEGSAKWMIVSGAGPDLISSREIHESEMPTMSQCNHARKHRTVNGVIHAELFGPNMLLPAVRRVDQGYSFAWDSANGARLKAPTCLQAGRSSTVQVENHVLILDERFCAALSECVHGETSAYPIVTAMMKLLKSVSVKILLADDHDCRVEWEIHERRQTQGSSRDYFPKSRYCKVCREVLKASTPGPGKSHSALVILDQRTGFRAEEMTRCAISQSGLQPSHWPFGADFKWEVWLFGASMRALIKGDKQSKFEPS
eukprot:6485537-Amphidinium_carterae.7